jgi:hypothetical protein
VFTLGPQQSPPSYEHSILLLISSQYPSAIYCLSQSLVVGASVVGYVTVWTCEHVTDMTDELPMNTQELPFQYSQLEEAIEFGHVVPGTSGALIPAKSLPRLSMVRSMEPTLQCHMNPMK